MRSAIRTVLLCLVSAAPLNARADAVDDYIEKQMQRQHIPGLSLAVVKDGKVIKANGYGLANIETKAPATPETVYQLASVTKQFTATAILLLVQDGKVALDDPVSRYLRGTPETWKDITVRHLLTHTSGIKDYLNELHENTREDTTTEKILRLVTGLPMNFAPGERFGYSNTGYVMLAMIVNEVSGKPYDVFLAERVFKPLGMNATRRSSLDDIIPNRAAGYTWTGSGWRNSPYLNPTLWDNGDGGMLSTVLDLAKWDAALGGDTLLTGAVKERMWTAGTLKDGKSFDYGFGWAVDQQRGHRRIWHSGGRPGTATIISRYVDDRITVILLTNSGASTERLCLGVARQYIASLGLTGPADSKTNTDRLTDYAGRYELANNNMLTIALEDGKLVDRSPRHVGVDWLPVSETAFVSEDLLAQITFDRNAQDEVIGLTWKSDHGEKKVPRIGPLVHDLEPQADPDPERTGRVRAVLEALAKGSQAVENVADMTPGAKKDFGRAAMKELAGLQSLNYVAEGAIGDRGVERHGGKVRRILYYKFTTPEATRCLLVHLTAEGLLTDLDIVDD
jgi:CubicO group peptidase (beta-lactamase class C family)